MECLNHSIFLTYKYTRLNAYINKESLFQDIMKQLLGVGPNGWSEQPDQEFAKQSDREPA